jgi:two-component system cell cycle response regulator
VTPPLVLVAEDSIVVRALLREQLELHGCAVVEADDGEAALAACRAERPDVVLLDIEMPKLDGREVLRQLKADPKLADTPVVFLTGRTHADDVVEALRLGAHDYLRKPVVAAELLARVTAAARIKMLQDELRSRNEELDRLARLDPLTGLHNRRHLDEHLRAMVSSSRRRGHSMAVLVVDVDKFKAVNDRLGHTAGDVVLCEVARRLVSGLRAEDVAGRWGGEEFLVLLPHTDLVGAVTAAERMREGVVAGPVGVATGEAVDVTISVGCAAGVAVEGEELVRRADAALYEAKTAGRNRVFPATPST